MKWEIFIALFVVTSSIAQKVPEISNPGIKPLSPKEIEEFSKFLEKTSVIGKVEEDVTVPADEDAWLNSGKFEGDIILDAHQRQKIVTIVGSTGRAVATELAYLWTDKKIPYMIKTNDYNASQVAAIKEVLIFLSNNSCLIFEDASETEAKDVIVIGGERRGCFSKVGKRGGKQVLNLDKTHPVGTGCLRVGAIAHEMFHALGFFHTQSRMDRDEYVKIYWENIKEGKERNFAKYDVDFAALAGRDLLDYDYESIMHYPRKAFSKNKQDTIVPLKSNTTSIGQREEISRLDILKLNTLYCNDNTTSRDESSRKRPRTEVPF